MKHSTLVLQDGTVFEGKLFGASKSISIGEVVFHTGLSGYQEIISDPSYAGQIVTFTYPHIGNYGTNKNDNESRKIFARGIIVRDYSEFASNHQSQQTLDEWLKSEGVSALTGIDTRKLTKHIREHGSMLGAFGTAKLSKLKSAIGKDSGTVGVDLVQVVTTKNSYKVGKGKIKVTAIDYGIKRSILNQLSEFATVTVMPAGSSAKEILATNPDGVFLSNGPGDPEIQQYAVKNIKELLGSVPIFGICLGHQLLATALGGKTEKLAFGHHGANHPVKNLKNGTIEITSQNHNFAVVESSLKNVDITHRNLNDNVVEGIKSKKYQAFSVQHHPEAGPGPHDARYLFKQFKQMTEGAN